MVASDEICEIKKLKNDGLKNDSSMAALASKVVPIKNAMKM